MSNDTQREADQELVREFWEEFGEEALAPYEKDLHAKWEGAEFKIDTHDLGHVDYVKLADAQIAIEAIWERIEAVRAATRRIREVK